MVADTCARFLRSFASWETLRMFEDIGTTADDIQMDIWDVLHAKGKLVHTVEPFASVREAVNDINRYGIGSLLVMDGDTVIGIFTERDVLRRVLEESHDPDATLVSEVMTTEVATVSPDESVISALNEMRRTRHRYLPVALEGTLIGIVSLGDLSRALVTALGRHVDYLKDHVESSAEFEEPYLEETG